ncbi:PREDICTED: protein FAM167A-like [Branchiostoma belcheri]|uniref:Protein FAM167A-like n=1 Tax=Branchiostoma belcheri TaxID=7741 RepID=A0A6P5AIC4_BRABE|nr:PREDICTED: protein FAM167A-like [Branchiostoma belcheri]
MTSADMGEIQGDISDLAQLKAMTTKLNLMTRRPSYVEWRKQLERPRPRLGRLPEGPGESRGDEERREDIDRALNWLRRELIDMRSQDQALARQLMSLRKEIHRLKLQKSCNEHQEMLEEVHEMLEDQDELSELSCDMPLNGYHRNLGTPLRQFGVTKMNIHSRRFSLC